MTDHDLDTLLADFHDGVLPMSDEAFEAGRARLTTLTESGRTEIPTLDPVLVELPPAQVRHGPRKRYLQLAAAAAAVVALGAGAIVLRGGEPVQQGVGNPAELAEWARGLADNPPAVAPGEYRHVRTHYEYARDIQGDQDFGTVSYLMTRTWIPYDFEAEWRLHKFGGSVSMSPDESTGTLPPGTFTSGGEEDQRAECGAFVNPGFLPPDGEEPVADPSPCDGDGWDGTASPAFFQEWSDPRKLYDELSARANGDSMAIFAQARGLLEGNMPNEFKAALYEALSMTPGLEVLDQVRGAGIGLRVTRGDTTELWVLDRETGDYLELTSESPRLRKIETFVYSVTQDEKTIPNDMPGAVPPNWPTT